MNEISRQLVHLSGVAFVLLLFYVPVQLVAMYSFALAFGLLIYTWYLRLERNRLLKLTDKLEAPFRKALLHFEKKRKAPLFAGAFWFFFSLGLTAVVFPLPVAAAAMWMLSIGDASSTVIGKNIGRKRVVGTKTWEGTLAIFLVSLTAVIFLPSWYVVVGAAVAALAEMIPETKRMKSLKKRAIVDDNLLIPIISGAVMWLLVML